MTDVIQTLSSPVRNDNTAVDYTSSPKSTTSRRRYKGKNSEAKKKVKMCRNYLRGIPCPFELRCAFSHGSSSTQTQSYSQDSPRSPKWRRFNARYSAFDGEEDYDGALTEDLEEEEEEEYRGEVRNQEKRQVEEHIAVEEQIEHPLESVDDYYHADYMSEYGIQMQYYPEQYYYYAQHAYYPYSLGSEMYDQELVQGEEVATDDVIDNNELLPPPPPPPLPPPPPAYEQALQDDATQQMVAMASMMMMANESNANTVGATDIVTVEDNNTPSVTIDEADECVNYEQEHFLQFAPPAYPTRYRHDPYNYEGFCYVL